MKIGKLFVMNSDRQNNISREFFHRIFSFFVALLEISFSTASQQKNKNKNERKKFPPLAAVLNRFL